MDEFMWAIGLFEGEGCVTFSNGERSAARMCVVSTDLDVLERFLSVVQVGYIRAAAHKTSIGKKPKWEWRLNRQLEIGRLLRLMMPHLGQRRQQQGQRVLEWIDRERPSKRGRKRRLDD